MDCVGENMKDSWISEDELPSFKDTALDFMQRTQAVSRDWCSALPAVSDSQTIISSKPRCFSAWFPTTLRLLHYFAVDKSVESPKVTSAPVLMQIGVSWSAVSVSWPEWAWDLPRPWGSLRLRYWWWVTKVDFEGKFPTLTILNRPLARSIGFVWLEDHLIWRPTFAHASLQLATSSAILRLTHVVVRWSLQVHVSSCARAHGSRDGLLRTEIQYCVLQPTCKYLLMVSIGRTFQS